MVHSAFSGGSLTGTISEGAGNDFDECVGDCFIMQVSTRHTGMGDTAGGGGQNADDVTAYISNIEGLTSGGLSTVEFTRAGSTNPDRIAWQILEYTGPTNGPNEMKVLDTGICSITTEDSCTGATIVGGAADDNDVAVIITGVSSDDAGTGNYGAVGITTEWKGASNVPVFNRTATGASLDISYAVVEFSGSDWTLQRVEHTGADSPSPIQTETISDVGDLTRAFILQAQQRTDGVDDGPCETGEMVYLTDTTTLSFLHEVGNTDCTYDGDMEEVVWVLSHSNTEVGKRMIVEHQQPSDQLNTSGAQEENWQRTISALTYGTDETGIFGFTSNVDGVTETNHPHGTVVATLTDSTTVDFWQSDSGEQLGYTFSAVQWPRSKVLSVSFTE